MDIFEIPVTNDIRNNVANTNYVFSIQSNRRLEGKTALVTGGNTGMGYETTRELARRGARVIMLCLDAEEGRRVAQQINQEFKWVWSEMAINTVWFICFETGLGWLGFGYSTMLSSCSDASAKFQLAQAELGR